MHHVIRIEHIRAARPHLEVALVNGGFAGLQWQPGRRPRGQPAVQDEHLVLAEMPQQPPASSRGERANVVVADDGTVVVHSTSGHRQLEVLHRGHRVPTAGASRTRRTSKIVIQVDEYRTRQVAVQVVRATVVAAELPTHVEQQRGMTQPGHPLLQLRDRQEWVGGHTGTVANG